MEPENSSKPATDYKEIICPIRCNSLLQEQQSVLEEYFEFCSTRLVLSAVNFDKKQLQLFGITASTLEAGKILV
jgi:hypothetical protein